MINKLKKTLKQTFIYDIVIKYREFLGFKKIEQDILNNAYYHHHMHDELIKIAKRNDIKVFIETGTYIGNTVFAVKDTFTSIYSIELSKKIYNLLKKRFETYSNINILNGDSTQVLNKILIDIDEPILFWLDAHYSSGGTAKGKKHTPIFEELKTIFNIDGDDHIILIDDMKDFNGTNDYPTIGELKKFVEDNSNYNFEIKDGIAYLTL